MTSRRGAEALIALGRVRINGVRLEQVGAIINEESDTVAVDGVDVRPVTEKVYVVLNKPRAVMTTLRDPFQRKTIRHYLKKVPQHVYPVGRLDFDTEGVLLCTNDGDLAYRLAHPKYQIPKIYEALVEGQFKAEDALQIGKGIKLEDGVIGKASVDILGFVRNSTRIRLTLTEGRKREVKQLCKSVRHPVELLTRIEFAGITAKNLKMGEWRFLSDKELARLKEMVGL